MAFQSKASGTRRSHGAGSGAGARGSKVGGSSGPKAVSKPVAKAVMSKVEPWTLAQWQAALPGALASLSVSVTDAQQQQLAAYMVLLAHWNATFNLTALRDPRDMLSHHLMDCLTVLAPLREHLCTSGLAGGDGVASARLLDVGSGGGLPGVVLAICCPDVQVSCVDTVGKKAAFIQQVAAELRLGNLRALHARVEQLTGEFDVITSRAFASLQDFVGLTRALLSPRGVWMAMKGKQPDDELSALPQDVVVFHVEQLAVSGLDAQRCLVWMRLAQARQQAL